MLPGSPKFAVAGAGQTPAMVVPQGRGRCHFPGAFSWKADERGPGSPAIGRMAGEGDGQGSRFIVKPVTFEQAERKQRKRCQHFPIVDALLP
jgi:hypothetical protein